MPPKKPNKILPQFLNSNEAKVEIDKLMTEISDHDHRYYHENTHIISDADYDAMRHKLADLEQAFPQLQHPNSPSNRVGAPIATTGFQKSTHSQPMLSLNNGFSETDIANFLKRIHDFLGIEERQAIEIFAEPKIDGLSVAIHYHDGILNHAITRGDGNIGEDVTANIKTLQDIPHRLIGDFPEIFEVRGEVYMEKITFHELNHILEKKSKKPFASPRHGAAGSLRQRNAAITAARPLRFFAFDWQCAIVPTITASEMMQKLALWGLPINPLNQICTSIEEILNHYQKIQTQRDTLPYEIDGIVYKINKLALRERLGFLARAPRWAIAHKFPAEKKQTQLKEITIQVGRTGTLTPVAELEPVTINGVRITRATLHNEDEIIRKDIRIGDFVEVQRAGDVIPQITRNITAETETRDRTTPAQFQFPKQCPECGSLVARIDNGKKTLCLENFTCPAQKIEGLKHFVSRGAFNIEGLGTKFLELFLQQNLIQNASDIFELKNKKPELLSLENFQEKAVDNLLAAIETARNISLVRFIYALGIHNIGMKTAKDIARTYKNVESIFAAWYHLDLNENQQFLMGVKGCSHTILLNIQTFFANSDNRIWVEKLCQQIHILPHKTHENIDTIWAEKNILFTGTLEYMGRAEAKEKAEQLGGTIISSVSKNLDYLITGKNPGNKLKKATELGVTILSEAEFFAIIEIDHDES